MDWYTVHEVVNGRLQVSVIQNFVKLGEDILAPVSVKLG